MGPNQFNCQINIVFIRVLIFLLSTIPGHSSYVISDSIKNNVTWLKAELNTQAVLRFDYEFIVEFPTENCCPVLSLYYAHRDYVKLKCFTSGAKGETVWFTNYIHYLIPKDNIGNRPYDGSQVSCAEKGKLTRCSGKFRLQNYEPKMRYFILGFFCEDLHSKNISLNGLKYEITVSDETNITSCETIIQSTNSANRCSKYLNLSTFPNVFGDYSQLRASFTFDSIIGTLEKMDTPCYKYLEQVGCITLFPPCLDVMATNSGIYTSKAILTPCREICEEFKMGCGAYLGQEFASTIYCGYFHYKEQSENCYYKEVLCQEPDFIPNGHYRIAKGNSSFAAGTVIEHLCENDYKLEGTSNSTCLLSGEWSLKFKCIVTQSDLDWNLYLFIGAPLLILMICVLVVIVVLLLGKRRSKKNNQHKNIEKRTGESDAFVSYYSEESSPEQMFVKEVLHPKLELQLEEPFKLLIHERDFIAGTNIVTNIMNAIKNSNSAIILLSQNYVNSRWCRDEFEWCIEEWKKEPGFGLYVILMEPDRELQGLSDYMQQYLRETTYLKVTDHSLWDKLINEMSKIRTEEYGEKIETTKV